MMNDIENARITKTFLGFASSQGWSRTTSPFLQLCSCELEARIVDAKKSMGADWLKCDEQGVRMRVGSFTIDYDGRGYEDKAKESF